MKTIIVWFRNDLRIHDHPALAAAIAEAEYVVPLFILDSALLRSDHASANRNRFLLESLTDLRKSLKSLGADLVVRDGRPLETLQSLSQELQADAVWYTADYTPYALKRDAELKKAFLDTNTAFRGFPGRLAVSSLDKIRTKSDTVFKVFTPFWKRWSTVERRVVAELPTTFSLPPNITVGNLPALGAVTSPVDLSPRVIPGGETEARKRLETWLDNGLESYEELHNDLAADATSRLSPYLHFGCLSVREIETMLPESPGARAWHRQLAWREFYHYIVYNFPDNTKHEFQERYRSFPWSYDEKLLSHWQKGLTGYPVVDAAMRQLNQEGWMHNRARLIVGSFLTKDLNLDWRLGEAYFMKMLIDGDVANNNGNWQWIASVGVDPAPVFRRLYNPTSQQANFDPTNAYVRKYVPELASVPDEFIKEPWKMTAEQQAAAACGIGTDYPAPIVDHASARTAALERYRLA
jgi:deoxyribodipyrimidine photo-lyase